MSRLLFGLFLFVAVWIVGPGMACPVRAASSEQPNVIVVLADDQGWGDLSLHGNPNLQTPNIDSLARDGAQVEHFYVCAVCSPTRAEFLTGRYHGRMGVYSTSAGGERFDAGERTIGDVFREAGYATAAYGKWHSGMQWPYHPNARGFDDYYGFCSGHWGNYFDPMLEHNGQIVQGKGFIIDDLTDHAIEFASPESEKPFLVYLALNTPHSPMQVPDANWERLKDKAIVADPVDQNAQKEDVLHTRAALAMCENIDENVGRLLKHLKSSGLERDTIVVYFSDNGPNGSRFNGGLRGRKGSTHEGGLRSPCLIRYPAAIQPGTVVRSIGGAIDLLPTLAELAGIDVSPSPTTLDGASLADQLRQADSNELNATDNKRMIFSQWNKGWTVRTQRYRMHHNGQLFDIQSDPREQNDIAGGQPSIASRLGDALKQWQESLPPRKPASPRPFPIAHPDAEWTQLPARDASFTGQIKRSNRFPNCTYLDNWSDTASKIQWDVEALGEGVFEVQMYYACPVGDVGGTIELSLGRESIRSKIQTPVESEFIGSPRDRTPRIEGDVRRWQPMTIGQLRIKKGSGTLTLKAIDVPGSQVAEFRMLMLRRID